MTRTAPLFTRMTGLDQLVWNITADQDLFCIWSIAVLAEALDDHRVEQALSYLIQTIPILNSRPIEGWFSGKWRLIERTQVKDLIARVAFQTDAEAKAHLQNVFTNPIPAKDMAMIRLISIDSPTRHYFVIQVHHLAMDGEGLKRICVRFAAIYKALYQDPDWRPAGPINPCRSWWQIARNFTLSQVGLMLKACVINAHELLFSLSGNFKIVGDPPAVIGNALKDDVTAQLYFERITVEPEAMVRLKVFTTYRDVTVNDVLMASLALSIRHWNRDCGDERTGVRFFYTANLRRWWGEPAGTFGNYSTLLLYQEALTRLADPATALAAVKSKMDEVKKRVGLDSFFILLLLKLMPYAFVRRLALWLKGKLFTLLKEHQGMTNIGIVFAEAGDFGHTIAQGYSMLAPTFPGGTIVYTITTYKNTTTIYLATSEPFLKKESARRFLRLWKEMLLRVIAIEADGEPPALP